MIIIAFLIGIFVGCSISLCIIASMVAKSNDYGNTKGNFSDFTNSNLNVIVKQDRIKRPKL